MGLTWWPVALSPKLSELWRRRVSVENHPGAGATFLLRFPEWFRIAIVLDERVISVTLPPLSELRECSVWILAGTA